MIRLPHHLQRILTMPYRAIARRRALPVFYWLWYNLVFRMVFMRWANDAERETLGAHAYRYQPRNVASTFRSVLHLFDQKIYTTAFGVRLTGEDVRVVEYAGVKIAVDETDPEIGSIIERGDYERHMVRFFQRVLRPGMIVIDVGANIGLFSLLAARQVGTAGSVYSVEPRGENARLLLYSATLNGFENIHLLPVAVGNDTGYTLYQTHIGANGALMTKGETGFDERAILHPTSQLVPMMPLESVVRDKVDVLKLDIEGAEGMALCGALELIRSHRPLITSEASMEMLDRVSRMTLRDYLLITRNLGYRQFVIERDGDRLVEVAELDHFLAAWPDPCHIEDFAFVPEERVDLLALLL